MSGHGKTGLAMPEGEEVERQDKSSLRLKTSQKQGQGKAKAKAKGLNMFSLCTC